MDLEESGILKLEGQSTSGSSVSGFEAVDGAVAEHVGARSRQSVEHAEEFAAKVVEDSRKAARAENQVLSPICFECILRSVPCVALLPVLWITVISY
jgi:hypothetical protein